MEMNRYGAHDGGGVLRLRSRVENEKARTKLSSFERELESSSLFARLELLPQRPITDRTRTQLSSLFCEAGTRKTSEPPCSNEC